MYCQRLWDPRLSLICERRAFLEAFSKYFSSAHSGQAWLQCVVTALVNAYSSEAAFVRSGIHNLLPVSISCNHCQEGTWMAPSSLVPVRLLAMLATSGNPGPECPTRTVWKRQVLRWQLGIEKFAWLDTGNSRLLVSWFFPHAYLFPSSLIKFKWGNIHVCFYNMSVLIVLSLLCRCRRSWL